MFCLKNVGRIDFFALKRAFFFYFYETLNLNHPESKITSGVWLLNKYPRCGQIYNVTVDKVRNGVGVSHFCVIQQSWIHRHKKIIF